MKNGQQVAAFEQAFAEYVQADYCIALTNGTSTLHTALAAMQVEPGQSVAVPPLTMSATTIAVLHAGCVPWFVDVDPDTWLMAPTRNVLSIPVSLYGLHYPHEQIAGPSIDDAAQTLRKHDPKASFTSYSFQASKILALGEGGMLATNDEELATRAREFSSLGYRMDAKQPRIDPATLKSPTYDRHHSLGWNYRMNDLTAAAGIKALKQADRLIEQRRDAAGLYYHAIPGFCSWVERQHTPDGLEHDSWTFALATDRATELADAVVKHGGERPYPAWRLTYHEPAFAHLKGDCPTAESLQPRLLQFATNDLKSAERNAKALARAIQEMS